MFIQVRLLQGFPQPLWYKVPDDWPDQTLDGSIVHVPLRTQIYPAIVIKQQTTKPRVPFALRTAHAQEQLPADAMYHQFIERLSMYYHIEPLHFFKRLKSFLAQKEIKQTTSHADDLFDIPHVTLTDEQQDVCQYVQPKIDESQFAPTLLHGVTGSGKTEVYKRLIEHAHANNKTTMLLLPEVTLAVQFERLLKSQLPHTIEMFGFHSATSVKDKRRLWHQLLAGNPVLIIGVHLPVLLPIANLGLIIVDEEHEVGFAEKKHPKLNTKEAALMRAQLHQIPIVLGSATPSISSLYNVEHKNWQLFELKKRFAGKLPKITTVKLDAKKRRESFWITLELKNALADRLAKGEQSIIFLNRRGYSFFVQCQDCAHIISCNDCSVSLTLHSDNSLRCHYCGHHQQHPKTCPSCQAKKFIRKGIGTQHVVQILQGMFPSARIDRADMDTTINKKKWQETLANFEQGHLDILVGTQTITKGYHFPKVTLVGIIWADLNLHFPMYNASETTLQQLLQVAGRAGRQSDESEVIVQTMSDHPIFNFLSEREYTKFYTHERALRELVGYPPYVRLVEIELKHVDESVVERESQLVAELLLAATQNSDIKILGPAQPPVSKIKKTYFRKIYVKGKNIGEIGSVYQKINHADFASSIFYTPNPVT